MIGAALRSLFQAFLVQSCSTFRIAFGLAFTGYSKTTEIVAKFNPKFICIFITTDKVGELQA